VIVFPNCKINLGLNITAKRPDGYHDLETLFYPVFLKDVLEIIHADNPKESLQYSSSGIAIDDDIENNLCVKAYHLLKKDFPALASIKLHLHKAIPMGAGLGGGSADGAFSLKLLNNLFNLNLSTDQLSNYAFVLGSDCPFFIVNKPSFATGRGEILEEINLDLSSYKIVIVNPGIHINTAAAFTKINPAIPAKSIKEIIQQPIATWRDELKNDFEDIVFEEHPEVSAIQNELYQTGAIYASMSGSGSTVYGIFKQSQPLTFNFPEEYFVYFEPHRT
jgi:4-diphosphocytidyl-2-C-methyl-D-erythritol kinase